MEKSIFLKNNKLLIATRSSPLALKQCEIVTSLLKGIESKIIPITTKGDKIKNKLLSEIGGKGLFIKEVEKYILEKRAHLAIHSLKDLECS